jgi:hypothetical protein
MKEERKAQPENILSVSIEEHTAKTESRWIAKKTSR